MSESKPAPDDIERLFKALGSHISDTRYDALMETRTLTPEQIVELVEVAKRSKTRSLWHHRLKIAFGLTILIGVLFPFSLPSFPFPFPLFTILGPMIVFYALLSETGRSVVRWQEENLVRVLENSAASGCVEAVLWMLGTAQGTARARLLIVLQHRLPELRASDVREWTARQKEPLKLLLRSWHQYDELAYCILKAMPEIGGAWALESVELLAKLEQWQPEQISTIYIRHRMQELPWQGRRRADLKPTRREIEETIKPFRRIGEAAAECLPGLRAKAMDEEAAKVLLRAAGVESQTQELLRPAGDRGAVTDPATLLRPGMRTSHSPEESASNNRH